MQVYSRTRSMRGSAMRWRKASFHAARPVRSRSGRGFALAPLLQASLVSAAGLAIASGLQVIGVV